MSLDDDRTYAREFLFKSIEDTQGTIRSLDAKAGIGIVVLGAMLSQVVDHDEFIAVTRGGWIPITAFVAFSLLAIVAAGLALKALFPMVNPTHNVHLTHTLRPQFFVGNLKPRRFLRLFSSKRRFAALEETHDDYYAALKNSPVENFDKILAGEVLKLSFIRQIKNDRVVALGKTLAVALVVFVILVFFTPKPPRSEMHPEIDSPAKIDQRP